MAKIKGWTKTDEFVWRRDALKGGNLHTFIWIASNNIVRINDGMPKNSNPLELVQNSYIMAKFRTQKDAQQYVMEFMKKHN